DFSCDDDLGKLLDVDDETVCSNLTSSWKSRNKNVSKFCCAMVDNSAKATKQKFLLGPDECKYDVNLNKLEMVKNYSVCNTQSFRNITISDDVFSGGTATLCHCPNEHAAESKPHSTLHQSGSPPLLPQATPASRLTFINRPLNFRPHDFFPHYSAPEYHSLPMLSDS
ncbi:hypothetical protein Taro_007807, partial [Colocasia esculenta]|nr:hypothetical protein [Colocasia esculenta]